MPSTSLSGRGARAALTSIATAGAIIAGIATAPLAQADDVAAMNWDQLVAAGKGKTVNWYMWGGSAKINAYVSDWVNPQMQQRYGITVNRVAIDSTVDAVNKVLGEKEAGVTSGGSVDMIWINGRNFQTMKQAGMLTCGYMEKMPNNANINWQDPTIAFDFGIPVDGCETPWGRAQMVVVYDKARTPNPPTSLEGLLAWAKANPGRFTYPALPDFTGMFFVKHVLYHEAGEYKPFIGGFDQTVFDGVAPKVWTTLRELEPSLWRKGETYPTDRAAMHQLFANGEVDFTLATHPDSVGSDIESGTFPPTTGSYVLDGGTVGDVHYVAIPFNSANKAAAIVLANFLISPEAQYEKSRPEVWGVRTALDLTRVPAEWATKFANLPRHPAVVDDAALARGALPQPNSEWIKPLEDGWREEVLKK
ncbi:MAG: ABC transporter substrate-binding protein [Rhizobiales bacterium]|nr:ABC transporter substrate-binding protein [Hyphomicrobiales bacterium]